MGFYPPALGTSTTTSEQLRQDEEEEKVAPEGEAGDDESEMPISAAH